MSADTVPVAPPRTKVVSGAALVLAAVVSVQIGAALAKHLFDRLGAPGVVWLRLTIAALVLVIAWRPWPWRRDRRWSRATLWQVAVFGLVIAAMNTTFYLSLARIPLGIAVTVEFIGPLALAAVLSRRWLDALWVLLALSGILLLVKTDGHTHLDTVGVLLAAVAGIFWAAYIVLSSKIGERLPGGSGLAAALVISALVTTPSGIASLSGHLTWPALAAAAGVALLSSAVPWSLEMEALRRVPAGVFSILMSMEPAVAALSGWALLHEHLLVRQWCGIAVVVVAGAGAAATSTRTRDELSTPAVQS